MGIIHQTQLVEVQGISHGEVLGSQLRDNVLFCLKNVLNDRSAAEDSFGSGGVNCTFFP